MMLVLPLLRHHPNHDYLGCFCQSPPNTSTSCFFAHLKLKVESSCCGSVVMNPTSIHEDAGSVPDPAQLVKGSGVAVSCGVGPRCGSDLVLAVGCGVGRQL